VRLEHWLYTIPLRVRSIFRRAQVEHELDEELRLHLEQLMAQEIAGGKTPDEARHSALRAMDGIERQKEKCRDARRVQYIGNFVEDFRHGLRIVRKSPAFTSAVTAILALGIGANTAVFSIVDAVLLRPLPYASSSRLVKIEETSTKLPNVGISAQEYLQWRDRGDLFEKIAAYVRDDVTATGIGEPAQVIVRRTSAGLFSLLGVSARLGRALVDADDDPNAPKAAVLSDRLWRRLYQADPGVVGRAIRLSDEPYTIVGVMPPEFEFPDWNVEMWIPFRLTPAFGSYVGVVARIKAGLSIPRIQSAMDIVAGRLAREEPREKAGLRIEVSPWQETAGRQYELTLVFVLVAVGLVLLIACANVGSLLLSRAVQRQKEIAIRASLGAGFWRVMRQLLAESLVLAAFSSAIGMAAAQFALRFLTRQLAELPILLPRVQAVAVNDHVLLFNSLLCLLIAGICSIAPVVLASKTDLQTVLRSGHASSRGSARLFSILIGSEAALAFLLLVGSGLMVRSLIRLEEADHGFHPDHVLTMRVPIGSLRQIRPSSKYDTKPRQIAYYHDLVERLQSVPGVKAVAVVNNLPLSGVNTSVLFGEEGDHPMQIAARTISPQYFSVMGIPLIAGRPFSESDRDGSTRAVIVNEYLAHQLFRQRDAVGQVLPGSDPPVTVVGVVKDSSQMSYEEPAEGELYHPYQQHIFGVFLSAIVVRTTGDPLSLAATLRKEVWAVDPDQPIVKVETMSDVIADSIWRPRFSAWTFSVLGGLALLLTSAGVYGVVAYTAALRTREVGIRVALGARPLNVVAVIMRDAMIPVAVGLAVSLVAAVILSRLLTSVLYEISSTDPVTYLGAGMLLLGIGAAASVLPAWRAATRDPLQTLRTE
jgi:predicted permease